MIRPEITVIIPTVAELSRADMLRRAIESCFTQKSVSIFITIVINGDNVDEKLYEELTQNSKVSTIRIPQCGAPNARFNGLKSVKTEFYCFLDDDDEFLPDIFNDVLEVFSQNREVDIVVTSGYKKFIGSECLKPLFKRFPTENGRPLDELINGNWLASCGGFYRSSSVSQDLFENLPDYFEWTYIAIKISKNFKIHFHQTPSFIIHQTDGSLSSKFSYDIFEISFLTDAIKNYKLPKTLKNHYKNKLASEYNTLANQCLKKDCRLKALRNHLKCLFSSVYGLKYLTWTRNLLKPNK